NIVARASSDQIDARLVAFTPQTPLRPARQPAPTTSGTAARVEFDVASEHFLGQSFNLNPADANGGRLVLASSLDQALRPLRALQRQILFTALAACAVAIVACRIIAMRIARPIQELVAGTRRIASGQFDSPVNADRRDELGILAQSFNQMSQGLKERDGLREERTKIERDLAVARRIQM